MGLIDEIRKANAIRGNSGQQPSLIDEIRRSRASAVVSTDDPEPASWWSGRKRYVAATLLAVLLASYATKKGLEGRYDTQLERERARIEMEYSEKLSSLESEVSSMDDAIGQTNKKKTELEERIAYLRGEIAKYKGDSEQKQRLEKEISKLRNDINALRQYSLDGISINDDYKLVIVDKDLQIPFDVPKEAYKFVKGMKNKGLSDSRKSRMIYDWVESNIKYGVPKSERKKIGYMSSSETMLKRRGVCGEMAYVYVTMARLAGLESKWVEVARDYNGERVQHACASVSIDGKTILVDPAYHTYDIKHELYMMLDDKSAIRMFQGMRQNTR